MSVVDSETKLAGKRVLVVEDESLVSMMLEDYLEELGCVLAGSAARLPSAQDAARTLTFDVAVLDVNLDGQESFSVADILTRRNIPFVFSTGYGGGGLPDRLKGKPVLQKPFLQADLARVLSRVL